MPKLGIFYILSDAVQGEGSLCTAVGVLLGLLGSGWVSGVGLAVAAAVRLLRVLHEGDEIAGLGGARVGLGDAVGVHTLGLGLGLAPGPLDRGVGLRTTRGALPLAGPLALTLDDGPLDADLGLRTGLGRLDLRRLLDLLLRLLHPVVEVGDEPRRRLDSKLALDALGKRRGPGPTHELHRGLERDDALLGPSGQVRDQPLVPVARTTGVGDHARPAVLGHLTVRPPGVDHAAQVARAHPVRERLDVLRPVLAALDHGPGDVLDALASGQHLLHDLLQAARQLPLRHKDLLLSFAHLSSFC
jgi:hypothetical protein